MSIWHLRYDHYDPAKERLREALCTVGNGYLATRGAAPEASAGATHYPGTYAAGVFNRLVTEVAGEAVENECMVNVPNWLVLALRVDDGDWFDIDAVEILEFRQELDLAQAVLSRRVRYRDAAGRVTRLSQRRFVHMGNAHLAGLETTVQAENWSGRLCVRSALDGRVRNRGVERYHDLRGDHLDPVAVGETADDTVVLETQTSQSLTRIAQAARTRVLRGGEPADAQRTLVAEDAFVAHDLTVDLAQGEQVTVEKVVALYTSRDRAIAEPRLEAETAVSRARGFDLLLGDHVARWNHLWRRFRLETNGHDRTNLVLNLHVYHLLVTVSENSVDLDVGVPARGLHGEAYRGHIFWDELFIFPYLNLHMPELTRSLLRYRHRRLPEAREAARAAGYSGAMFPWQSGSNGREESQQLHLNPKSGRWLPDHSHLQRHIGVAVAYNVWQYYQTTGDMEFLAHYGAELILDLAKFWASIATYNDASGRYEICGVLGPDEYHEAYPDRDTPGLDNNAYTNVMAVWVLLRAFDVLDVLPPRRREELADVLGLSDDELDRWDDVSRRLHVPFTDSGAIAQFTGYDRLEPFDWEGYRARYGNIQRLDRILEAEGDTPNRYQVSKQADVLMLFYLLSTDELAALFDRLGYAFSPELVPATIAYYEARTSHGSTLSRVVSSWVLARSDRARSWNLFLDALESDVSDIQNGTTPEGIHLGAMAGTVDLMQRCYTGLETRDDVLWLNPVLPAELDHLAFDVRYRDHWGLAVEITHERLRVSAPKSRAGPVRVGLCGMVVELSPGASEEIALEPAS